MPTELRVAVFVLLLALSTVLCTDPLHEELAKRARYIVHKADWCTLITISSDEHLLGQPLPTPSSVSDGPIGKSSGIPYVFQPTVSNVVQDVLKDSKVTLSFSEAEFGLKECLLTTNTDPEWPLCARLTLIGDMHILKDPAENTTAKEALFSRHPAMASWHAHKFVFLKLDITKILLLDYFGGWHDVSTKDYFSVQF